MLGNDVSNDEVDLLDAPLVSEDDPVLGGQLGQHKQVGEERLDVSLENSEYCHFVFQKRL